jgi:hypothetical protein
MNSSCDPGPTSWCAESSAFRDERYRFEGRPTAGAYGDESDPEDPDPPRDLDGDRPGPPRPIGGTRTADEHRPVEGCIASGFIRRGSIGTERCERDRRCGEGRCVGGACGVDVCGEPDADGGNTDDEDHDQAHQPNTDRCRSGLTAPFAS